MRSFDELTPQEQEIVIMDEAHTLINLLESSDDKDRVGIDGMVVLDWARLRGNTVYQSGLPRDNIIKFLSWKMTKEAEARCQPKKYPERTITVKG